MTNRRVPPEVVAQAVQKAGDHVKLSKLLHVTYQAVSYWLRAGAPSWRRDAIERYIGPDEIPAPPRRGSRGRPLKITSAAGRKAALATREKRRRLAEAQP